MSLSNIKKTKVDQENWEGANFFAEVKTVGIFYIPAVKEFLLLARFSEADLWYISNLLYSIV